MAHLTPVYSDEWHILPRTRGKMCHKTTFFSKAIFLKQFIWDPKWLLPGMHNILNYINIF